MQFLGFKGDFPGVDGAVYHSSALGNIWGGARVGLHIVCCGETLLAGIETVEAQAGGSPHGPTSDLL